VKRRSDPATKERETPPPLKGWQQIADFLGQPTAVVQGWGRSGMPVSRQGRFVTASPEDLNRWLGRESGLSEPAHIAGNESDLSAELKRGLAALKQKNRGKAVR
jgi:hypothetical protein